MSRRVVLAWFGDRHSMAALAAASRRTDVEAIAVVFDIGRGPSLAGLKDAALACGAVKCHALDVREEFAREVTIRAFQEDLSEGLRPRITWLAERLITQKLAEIAALERADVVHAALPESIVEGSPIRSLSTEPACLDLRFAHGEPIALNDIPMSLPELIDSLETITGLAATEVLALAYRELGAVRDGHVVLLAEGRVCRAAEPAGV
jgi:argininosuccinate synthase